MVAGCELQLAVLGEQPVEERRGIGTRLVGRVDPRDGDRVRKPGGVREQVPARDRGGLFHRAQVLGLRHQGKDRAVEVERAGVGEAHRDRRGDDLGHREPRADHGRGRGALCGEIGVPECAGGTDPVAVNDRGRDAGHGSRDDFGERLVEAASVHPPFPSSEGRYTERPESTVALARQGVSSRTVRKGLRPRTVPSPGVAPAPYPRDCAVGRYA